MPNRLARETSPYLQQHKDNPVDWYPWGEEAFSRARAEDRPVLLSVGYSACHWCHVMEHESFADPVTAEIMNQGFVNIKVDREERPDVDSIYMHAVQQMTGHGGWPMTVFLTPDGLPFFGGTYYPPEPRHGLPSFRQLLEAIQKAYATRRDEVARSAEELRDSLTRGMSIAPDPQQLDPSLLTRAFDGIAARYDAALGGFGGAPKFPQPMLIEFLLQYATLHPESNALAMAEGTLEAMARGGMYDQVGGGFHRYSVDARWLVPHFEKMLYDNALLAMAYLHAYQLTERDLFRRVTTEVLDYVLLEMRSPSGGFYSSQDADSEGVEGKFYVWSAEEIDEVLGTEDAPIFRAIFDVHPGGNWEGSTILNRARGVDEVADEFEATPAMVEEVIATGRKKLYARRSERIWPGRDEKVLTSWNAMMLSAFAEAGRVLGRADYTSAAVDCASFLLTELRPDGRLLRSWRDGEAKINGFLEDQALLVDALLELYATTFDARWVEEARNLADQMLDLFWDPENEVFFDAALDGEALAIRPRDIYDNATPSGNSAATRALLRLGRLTGEPRFERAAGQVLGGMGRVAAEIPQGFGQLLRALTHFLSPPTEVAIVGDRRSDDAERLLAVVRRRFLPHTAVAFLDTSGDVAATQSILPLLQDRTARNGHATAYVCRHFTCKQPVSEPAALELDLDAIVGPGRAPG